MIKGYNFIKEIRLVFIFIFFAFGLLFSNYKVYGQVKDFDTNMSPSEVYKLIGDEPVYNKRDGTVTFVTKVTTKGSGSANGYNRFGLRIFLSNTGMFVDIRTGQKNGVSNSKYSVFTQETVGNYFYYKNKISLGQLLDLYAKAYPNANVGAYFKTEYTLQINSLVGIRRNNVYYCETDLVENGNGRFSSAKATAAGLSPYHHLYGDRIKLSDTYKALFGVEHDFREWYDRYIPIEPNNVKTVEYDIKAGPLSITGDRLYMKNDIYYVKTGSDYNLSFYSGIYNGKTLIANGTYQPCCNELMHYRAIYNGYMIPVSDIFTTSMGAAKKDVVYKATYEGLHKLNGYEQWRSNDMKTLTTRVTAMLEKDNQTITYYSVANMYIEGKLMDRDVCTKGLRVISDGIGPELKDNGIYDENMKKYRIEIFANDLGAGTKNIQVYDKDGKKRLGMVEGTRLYIELSRESGNSYIIKAIDNVGNESTASMELDFPKEKVADNWKVIGTH